MWLQLGIISALFLGIYEVLKKSSVRENAVLPVLFLATCFGATITLPLFALSRALPETMTALHLYAGIPSRGEHLLISLKALLVSASWISVYFALKHLPISIVSPIRASSPLWTLLGAVLLFGERLLPIHWVGIGITFASYYVFSLLSAKEGIAFMRNRFILLVFIATITGAISALYDKYLLHIIGIPPVTLQVWFSFYLVAVTGAVSLVIHAAVKAPSSRFEWRYTIPFIGIFLFISDYLYFRALNHDDALIAVLSVIRRSSVVISFVFGGLLFKEKNKRKKAIPLIGVLIGIALLLIKS